MPPPGGIATVIIQGKDQTAAAFAASEQEIARFAERSASKIGPLGAEIVTLTQRQREMDQQVALGHTGRAQHEAQLRQLIVDTRELAARTAAGSAEQEKLAAIAGRAQAQLHSLGRAERTSVDGFEAFAGAVQAGTMVMEGNIAAAGGMASTFQRFFVNSPGMVNMIGGIGAAVTIVGLLASAWANAGKEAEAAAEKQRQAVITGAQGARIGLNLSPEQRLERRAARVQSAQDQLASLPGDVAIPIAVMRGRAIANQADIDAAREINIANEKRRQQLQNIVQIEGAEVATSRQNLATNRALEESLRNQRTIRGGGGAEGPSLDEQLDAAHIQDALAHARASIHTGPILTTRDLFPSSEEIVASLAGTFDEVDQQLQASLPGLDAWDEHFHHIQSFIEATTQAYTNLIGVVSHGSVHVVQSFLKAEALQYAGLAAAKAGLFFAEGLGDLLFPGAAPHAARAFAAAAAFSAAAVGLNRFAGSGGGGGGGSGGVGVGSSISAGNGGTGFAGAARRDVTIEVPREFALLPRGRQAMDWFKSMAEALGADNVVLRTV
jgi:hypothetical protein